MSERATLLSSVQSRVVWSAIRKFKPIEYHGAREFLAEKRRGGQPLNPFTPPTA